MDETPVAAETGRTPRRWSKPAWEIMRRPLEDGGYKSYCRAECSGCGAHQEIPWNYNGTVPPDELKRRWQREGWSFDARVAKRCRCPECNKKGGHMKTQVQTVKNGVDLHPPPPLPPPIEVEVKKLEVVKGTPRPSPATLAAGLTPPQRKKIRDLLDAAYDDATSMYLAGHSDQQIGKALDIPWAAVAYLREQAYGPLKEDPRLVELGRDLDELSDLLANLHVRLQAGEDKIATLREQLAALGG